jgi:hypothetical protein
LEEGLERLRECAVVISQRPLVPRPICTHIIAFEGNSDIFVSKVVFEYEKTRNAIGDEGPKRILTKNRWHKNIQVVNAT